MKLPFLFFIVFGLSSLYAAAPDWLADSTDSLWIVCGENSESNGITVRTDTGEGDMEPVEGGWQSIREDGNSGYFYFVTEPWDTFKAWLGEENDVLLTIRYFDGDVGKLVVSYDSSDARVKNDPYPPGVWKHPDEYPDGIPLTGDYEWRTLSVRLPLAFFNKRQHDSDFRLDPLQSPNFVLGGVALSRIPKEKDQDASSSIQMKQELRLLRSTGLTTKGQVAHAEGKFIQKGDEPIVMEGELASAITPQQGDGLDLDPDASGGGVLHFVERAEFKFHVATPGKYTIWLRAFYPHKGSWSHFEWVDGQPEYRVEEGWYGPEEGWQWTRTRTFDFSAGEHTLGLTYQNGSRLDMMVLVRNDSDTPPNLADLKSSFQGPMEGEIWTAPVQPLDVAQWKNVQFHSVGEIQAKMSNDGGKTWQPIEDLAKLPIQGGGKDSLQFHITARSRDGKTPPLFGGGILTYETGPQNTRTVENDRLKVEMDPYGVKAIVDKKTGATIVKAEQIHDSLLSFVMKTPGASSPFSRDLYDATLENCEVHGDTMTLTHRFDTGLTVATTIKLLPNGQSEWQFAVDNQTEFEVAEFQFPLITGIRLNDHPEDDWLFIPKCWGQVTQNPGEEGKTQSSGESTPMQWMMVWDDTSGLYLGIEDPRYEDYAFSYKGDPAGGAILSAWQRTLIKPHSKWKSGVYRLAVTGGDWHEGADIYRDYAARTLKSTDTHPYVKWLVDAWMTQPSNDAVYRGWDMIRPGGEPLMAANRQMLDGADSGYCGLYPMPSTAWGSLKEYSQKLGVRRALGGFYIPYHNFHLWAPGYGHYQRIGSFPKSRIPKDFPVPDDDWYEKAAAKNYDGSYRRMETDYFAQCDMAMGSQEWRDWLADWTSRYLDWGADGMYYDQYNMIYANGWLYPGYDTYGSWATSLMDLTQKMRKESREKNPYYVSSGEVASDIYGQYLDLHMTSAVWNRLEFFRYAIPHQLLIDGGWNGGLGEGFGGTARNRFIWQVGARFEQPPADGRLLSLRRAVKSLLYDATFRDTVGITIRDGEQKPIPIEYTYNNNKWQNASFSGVNARWFLYEHDNQHGAIVNLINAPVQKGATCTIRTSEFGAVTSALAVTLDGVWFPVEGKQEGDTFTFPVPEAECSSVVLAGRLPPVVRWNVESATARDNAGEFHLTLTNPNAAPITGQIQLRLPEGWALPKPTTFGPLATGQSQSFTVAFTVPSDAKLGRTDIWCDVQSSSGDFAAYGLLVVNEPVIADFRGDPGNYHLWLKNLTDKPLTGQVLSCSAPAKELQIDFQKDFSLPAQSEKEVPITVTGQDKLSEISELTAKITVGTQTFECVRAVIPVLPNGNFESDVAGDLKPDWWMSRKKDEDWSYERMHLAEGAQSGKYCLQLDPPESNEEFIYAYPVHSALKPNTSYRVSVWVKSDSNEGVYVKIMDKMLGNQETGPEWKQFTTEFTTEEGMPSLSGVFYNASSSPAYFDNLIIEEI